jgi:hypothetical protein
MRRAVIIFIFLAVIASPVAGWVSGLRTGTSEKRTLSALPELSLKSILAGSFYKGFEKFHDDRFPFRGWIIKAKNWVDYRMFRASPSADVHIGRDGWLFYVPSLPDYIKEDCAEREKMKRLAKDLQELEQRVESTGRGFLFVVVPNKSTIYPEYVALERSSVGCGRSRLELLIEAFAEHPVKNYLLLEEALEEAKDDNLLYHKTDTHWNIHGARVASGAILERLAPLTWTKRMPEVKVKAEKKDGDLADMIEMFGGELAGLEEYAEEISHASNVNVQELPPLSNRKPRLKIIAEPPAGRQLLPNTLIYHDSFMKLPLKLLEGSFEELNTVWSFKVPSYEGYELEEIRSAEIIIVEIIERDLPYLEIVF